MLNPNGPNFLLSSIVPWKRHNENSKHLNGNTFSCSEWKNSMRSLTWFVYALNMFALMPAGGSTVILLPFCKMATGKCGEGVEVSQILKSLWTTSGWIVSMRRSRRGIQLGARWQFCRCRCGYCDFKFAWLANRKKNTNWCRLYTEKKRTQVGTLRKQSMEEIRRVEGEQVRHKEEEDTILLV